MTDSKLYKVRQNNYCVFGQMFKINFTTIPTVSFIVFCIKTLQSSLNNF